MRQLIRVPTKNDSDLCSLIVIVLTVSVGKRNVERLNCKKKLQHDVVLFTFRLPGATHDETRGKCSTAAETTIFYE